MKSRIKPEEIANSSANLLLDPDIREIVGHLNAKQRLAVIEKFVRWSEQLYESALLMNPKIVEPKPAPKIPPGFFLLNLSKWQQDELRELAKECGVNLRTAINMGVISTQVKLRKEVEIARKMGIKPSECWRYLVSNPSN